MTNVIAPVGTAVASMGRRGSQSFDSKREQHEPAAEAEEAIRSEPGTALPPPDDEPLAVMPGALFTTTLIAQDLPASPAALRPQLLARQGWTPPHSSLRLKDAIA